VQTLPLSPTLSRSLTLSPIHSHSLPLSREFQLFWDIQYEILVIKLNITIKLQLVNHNKFLSNLLVMVKDI